MHKTHNLPSISNEGSYKMGGQLVPYTSQDYSSEYSEKHASVESRSKTDGTTRLAFSDRLSAAALQSCFTGKSTYPIMQSDPGNAIAFDVPWSLPITNLTVPTGQTLIFVFNTDETRAPFMVFLKDLTPSSQVRITAYGPVPFPEYAARLSNNFTFEFAAFNTITAKIIHQNKLNPNRTGSFSAGVYDIPINLFSQDYSVSVVGGVNDLSVVPEISAFSDFSLCLPALHAKPVFTPTMAAQLGVVNSFWPGRESDLVFTIPAGSTSWTLNNSTLELLRNTLYLGSTFRLSLSTTGSHTTTIKVYDQTLVAATVGAFLGLNRMTPPSGNLPVGVNVVAYGTTYTVPYSLDFFGFILNFSAETTADTIFRLSVVENTASCPSLSGVITMSAISAVSLNLEGKTTMTLLPSISSRPVLSINHPMAPLELESSLSAIYEALKLARFPLIFEEGRNQLYAAQVVEKYNPAVIRASLGSSLGSFASEALKFLFNNREAIASLGNAILTGNVPGIAASGAQLLAKGISQYDNRAVIRACMGQCLSRDEGSEPPAQMLSFVRKGVPVRKLPIFQANPFMESSDEENITGTLLVPTKKKGHSSYQVFNTKDNPFLRPVWPKVEEDLVYTQTKGQNLDEAFVLDEPSTSLRDKILSNATPVCSTELHCSDSTVVKDPTSFKSLYTINTGVSHGASLVEVFSSLTRLGYSQYKNLDEDSPFHKSYLSAFQSTWSRLASRVEAMPLLVRMYSEFLPIADHASPVAKRLNQHLRSMVSSGFGQLGFATTNTDLPQRNQLTSPTLFLKEEYEVSKIPKVSTPISPILFGTVFMGFEEQMQRFVSHPSVSPTKIKKYFARVPDSYSRHTKAGIYFVHESTDSGSMLDKIMVAPSAYLKNKEVRDKLDVFTYLRGRNQVEMYVPHLKLWTKDPGVCLRILEYADPKGPKLSSGMFRIHVHKSTLNLGLPGGSSASVNKTKRESILEGIFSKREADPSFRSAAGQGKSSSLLALTKISSVSTSTAIEAQPTRVADFFTQLTTVGKPFVSKTVYPDEDPAESTQPKVYFVPVIVEGTNGKSGAVIAVEISGFPIPNTSPAPGFKPVDSSWNPISNTIKPTAGLNPVEFPDMYYEVRGLLNTAKADKAVQERSKEAVNRIFENYFVTGMGMSLSRVYVSIYRNHALEGLDIVDISWTATFAAYINHMPNGTFITGGYDGVSFGDMDDDVIKQKFEVWKSVTTQDRSWSLMSLLVCTPTMSEDLKATLMEDRSVFGFIDAITPYMRKGVVFNMVTVLDPKHLTSTISKRLSNSTNSIPFHTADPAKAGNKKSTVISSIEKLGDAIQALSVPAKPYDSYVPDIISVDKFERQQANASQFLHLNGSFPAIAVYSASSTLANYLAYISTNGPSTEASKNLQEAVLQRVSIAGKDAAAQFSLISQGVARLRNTLSSQDHKRVMAHICFAVFCGFIRWVGARDKHLALSLLLMMGNKINPRSGRGHLLVSTQSDSPSSFVLESFLDASKVGLDGKKTLWGNTWDSALGGVYDLAAVAHQAFRSYFSYVSPKGERSDLTIESEEIMTAAFLRWARYVAVESKKIRIPGSLEEPFKKYLLYGESAELLLSGFLEQDRSKKLELVYEEKASLADPAKARAKAKTDSSASKPKESSASGGKKEPDSKSKSDKNAAAESREKEKDKEKEKKEKEKEKERGDREKERVWEKTQGDVRTESKARNESAGREKKREPSPARSVDEPERDPLDDAAADLSGDEKPMHSVHEVSGEDEGDDAASNLSYVPREKGKSGGSDPLEGSLDALRRLSKPLGHSRGGEMVDN